MDSFKIANRKIGSKFKPLIIVELGINHNGNLNVAKKIIDKAKIAGAEIITFSAPPFRWPEALSPLVKNPGDSITRSTPSSPDSIWTSISIPFMFSEVVQELHLPFCP